MAYRSHCSVVLQTGDEKDLHHQGINEPTVTKMTSIVQITNDHIQESSQCLETDIHPTQPSSFDFENDIQDRVSKEPLTSLVLHVTHPEEVPKSVLTPAQRARHIVEGGISGKVHIKNTDSNSSEVYSPPPIENQIGNTMESFDHYALEEEIRATEAIVFGNDDFDPLEDRVLETVEEESLETIEEPKRKTSTKTVTFSEENTTFGGDSLTSDLLEEEDTEEVTDDGVENEEESPQEIDDPEEEIPYFRVSAPVSLLDGLLSLEPPTELPRPPENDRKESTSVSRSENLDPPASIKLEPLVDDETILVTEGETKTLNGQVDDIETEVSGLENKIGNEEVIETELEKPPAEQDNILGPSNESTCGPTVIEISATDTEIMDKGSVIETHAKGDDAQTIDTADFVDTSESSNEICKPVLEEDKLCELTSNVTEDGGGPVVNNNELSSTEIKTPISSEDDLLSAIQSEKDFVPSPEVTGQLVTFLVDGANLEPSVDEDDIQHPLKKSFSTIEFKGKIFSCFYNRIQMLYLAEFLVSIVRD